jgi:serine/threonine-protein kinase
MSVETTVSQPVLDEATRDFVRRTLHAGLVDLADVKKVVVSLIADDVVFTPERLAEGLVGADLLTPWQSRKLLAGKSRGFHLGNYRLLRPLGRGGMGVVFLAQHSVMNRLMALKILPSEASKDARRIERFKEEARASARLEHPNIVQAYDFSQFDGKMYIVMEYVEGIDLQRAILRDGVMSSPEALDAMIQTTDALAHAHQRGIVHRDIKPSNLLLRNDGVIKVSDMGLARIGYTASADSDAPSRLTGTADFIAPEQAIDSRSVDARADIYSLGCTWYFLLVGKPPFSGNSVMQRLAKHQTATAPSVSESRTDCPAAICELIQRMMAKRPSERPASAAELLGQLKRIAGSSPTGGELANRPHSGRAVFVSEDASSFSSIDDSGPLKEAGSSLSESQEIDFGSLPPVDLSTLSPANVPASPLSSPMARHSSPSQRDKPDAGQIDAQQNVLLGIGLALSIVALLAVVGTTIYQMTKTDSPTPKLKTMEDGKGNVIVVAQP